MIFPHLELEATVQVGDRTRLSAVKSFVTQDEAAISMIEISPYGAASGYIDVTEDMYLDWQYSASGTINVACRVTASGASADFTSSLSVVTAASDYLYSNDNDLRVHEPDILKWVEQGRNSFINMHRAAQKNMIDWLRKEGYVDTMRNPYTKTAIVHSEEVNQWSTFLTLRLIFEGLSNAIDDIFAEKAKRYKGKEVEWRNMALLRLDVDGDGEADNEEGIDTAFTFVARR